jgi:hypothetical protein
LKNLYFIFQTVSGEMVKGDEHRQEKIRRLSSPQVLAGIHLFRPFAEKAGWIPANSRRE